MATKKRVKKPAKSVKPVSEYYCDAQEVQRKANERAEIEREIFARIDNEKRMAAESAARDAWEKAERERNYERAANDPLEIARRDQERQDRFGW